MSNYKWVQLSDTYVELRKEDFSSVPRFEVNDINPLLMEKLDQNGVDYWLEGDDFFEPHYVLAAIDEKQLSITAPLYEYDITKSDHVQISNSYTEETTDPAEYERVKSIYLQCCKEVADEQAKVFSALFEEKSLDGGISSVVTISSDSGLQPNYFYEEYIPSEYIKVCEVNIPFSRGKHEVVFIKKMNAKGKVVTIKVHDFYKGLVIGKGGKNIKKVTALINAKYIKVIW